MLADPRGVAVHTSSPAAAISWPAPFALFRSFEMFRQASVIVDNGAAVRVVVVVVAEVVVMVVDVVFVVVILSSTVT